MDSGLGVRWPLSPFATALAAGALFTFCIALWKYRFIKSKEAGKDPLGRKFSTDLDPNKENDARDKRGKEKSEKEADKAKNSPVLAVRENQSRFNYEHLGLSGQFGAIPRTAQRRQSLENNIFPVLRRRGVERGRKNWQEFINPASINFSSIYQHPFCFGSEFGWNPGLFFSATHNLHTYFSQFKDAATPGTSKENDNFDVSIRPEILKNKPITRSALCLALQNQLHKFLNEPLRELRLNDRAIQTADISEELESPSDPSSNESDLRCDPKCESQDGNVKSGKVPLSALSLWDSGYGEKVFDEISNVSTEHEIDENIILGAECSSVSNAEPDIICDITLESDDLNLRKLSDSSKESSDDTVIIIVSEKQDISDLCAELSDSTNIETVTDFETNEYSDENIEENIPEDEEIVFLEQTLADENLTQYNDDYFPDKNSDFDDFSDTHLYSEENTDENIPEDEKIVFLEKTLAEQNLNQYDDDFPDKNPDFDDILDTHLNSDENIDENITEDEEIIFLEKNLADQNFYQYHDDFPNKNPDFDDISDTHLYSDENIGENNLEEEEIKTPSDQDLNRYDNDFPVKNHDFDNISDAHLDSEENFGENILEVEEIIFLENNSLIDQDLNRYDIDFPDKNPNFDDISDTHLDSGRESLLSNFTAELENNSESLQQPAKLMTSDLDPIQGAFPTLSEGGEKRDEFCDENGFRGPNNNTSVVKKAATRAAEVDPPSPDRSIAEKSSGADDLPSSERVQNGSADDKAGEQKKSREEAALSAAALRETDLSEKRNSGREIGARDVTGGGSSRDSPAFDERGTFNLPRQMDRETGERSVAVEQTVTTEATLRANGEARLSTAVVSRLTLDDWQDFSDRQQDSVSVTTTLSDTLFEDFVPLKSGEKIAKSEAGWHQESREVPSRNGNATTTTTTTKEFAIIPGELPSSPRVDRLKGLLCRDEERRARTPRHLDEGSHVMEGEWDRLLRDVLASVSELERWERRQCDVTDDAEDAEQQRHHHPFSSQSDSSSSVAMEEEALLLSSPSKGETPTKVKSLRFKLDPDIFDVPSDDSFYDDDEEDCRRSWKKQTKYRAFSSLELDDEPVRLVSVHASVVPAGQKMVARPVGIDLRVRLTEERQSKRAHVSTSPSQAKRRSPVSDRGWFQELSPVTENVDWRDTFTPVAPEGKSVPNGILKTPSPKIEPSPVESPNPFKLENGVTTPNGVSPVTENKPIEKAKQNGWKPVEKKKPFLLLPRKKFEPDPEAVERITGYRSALSKPPLPPPVPSKTNANIILKSRAEQARKQYLDNKNALAMSKGDGMKKFQQFLNQAQNDRARIVTSVPDLAAIERAVTEQWTKERASVSPRESPVREDVKKPDVIPSSCCTTPDDKWASYVQSCRKHLGRRSQSMSYLETDIDIIPVLDDDDKCQSVSELDEPDEALPDPDDSDLDRSREDLDDSGRAKSEHELRIERSLRSLPVPDWYRRSEKTKTGFLLGSSNKEKRGWAAAKSLASSTSSLASCGLRRPVRSLRSSRENIPWSRSSASPDGPTLSLALAKAFREPYLGWRARTPTSSGVSSSPRASPPSWGATTTDDEANGVSFDGEDAFGRTTSSEEDKRDEPLSLDDTGADAVTVSMDTNDPVKLPGGEDTCDDINNMSMDTCELFDASVVVPVDEDPSPQADTGDDIDNLSTDTTTPEGRKLDPKLKRYSYSQSIYHSEWDEEEESRGDRKGKEEEEREQSPSSPDHKVVWIESSFVGSRTTTSIVVLPEKKAAGSTQNRPASR